MIAEPGSASAAQRKWLRRNRQSVAGYGLRFTVVLLVLVAAAVLGQRPSPYLLALLGVVVVAVLLAREPRWGLIAVPLAAVLTPFQIGTGTDVSINAAVVAVPAMTVIWLLWMLRTQSLHFAPSRLNRPLVAFLLIAAIAWLRGNAFWEPGVPQPSNLIFVQGGQVVIWLFSFLGFWLTANLVTDLRWLRRLVYGVSVSLGIAAVCLLILRYLWPQIVTLLAGVLQNVVATWTAALALAMTLHDRTLKTQQKVILLSLAGAAVLAPLLLNRSWIGGWFPPLLASGIVLWIGLPRLRLFLLMAGVLLLVIVGIGPVLGATDWETEWTVSGVGRMALWRAAFDLGARSPLLGLGPAAYRLYGHTTPLALGGAYWVRPNISSHNQFLDLFAQIGLLGAACYVWFLVETLILAAKQYRRQLGFAKGYALAVLCAMIGMFAADMWAETSLPFVYNMGFVGFRASLVGWVLLGGLVTLENKESDA